MNQHLQTILNTIQQNESLSAEEKSSIEKYLKEAGKELDITAFKLERTEIVKRTTAILLEETIAELEQKRKAVEAQNRELEIEGSLERIRASAMAMHNSEELNALVGTVFTELTKLDFVLTRCVIMIYDPKTNDARWLMANSEAPDKPMNFFVKYHEHPPNLAYLKAWQKRTLKWQYFLQGTIKKHWDDFIFSETELSLLPDFVVTGMRAPDSVYLNASFANFGNLTLASLEPLSDEHFNILLRFAKVFDLTYTRFNDLKQAEAQAREAEIELSLERVRSRSMAMHKSEELRSVVNTLYGELQSLHVNFHVVAIQLFPDNSMDLHLWLSTADGMYDDIIHWPHTDLPVFHEMYKSRTTGTMLEFTMSETATRQFFEEYFKLDSVPQERKTAIKNVKLIDVLGAYQKLTGIFLMRYTKGS